ncbi:glycosyltransferase [Paenibacillus sp. MMS18-CY102]|uniref:glycosyltransferase n=1 Tax=Paenibacillus sp. MMS18-CY102 TaxID=2682849 RepID=UPI0013665299|nr:glycosyltransferase [Paenibacillus sp. MMS18-CY102]
MKILLIIPAYNEQKSIISLIEKIRMENIENLHYVVINDCSTDRTADLCVQHNVPVVKLPSNLGIGGAVQTGYKYALYHNFDIAIQVDGDGQHDPKYIKELIAPLLKGESDLVIGSRYIDKKGFQSTFMRRLGIRYFTKLLYMMTKQTISDPTSGFRACNKELIGLFSKRYPTDYPEPESIMYLKRNNYRIKEVSVQMNERSGGVSSITSIKSVYYMLKVSMAIVIDRMRRQIV